MSVVIPPQEILAVTFPHVIAFLNALGQGLIRTRGFEGLRASSWYRDRETNIRVGGHPDSQHLLGLALDVTGPDDVRADFILRVREAGLIAVDEFSHAHVQLLRAGTARGEGFFA